jgi:hypothetical protein
MTTATTTTTTVPRDRLDALDTAALIEQYRAAIATRHRGPQSGPAGTLRRISYIVDLISKRADRDDPIALAWYEED